MDQRLRNRLRAPRSALCAPAPAGIQTTGFVFAARMFYDLHNSADRLERAARLDHAAAFTHPRQPGRRRWLSTTRAAQVFWRALPLLLTVAFCRPGLGSRRQLASGE